MKQPIVIIICSSLILSCFALATTIETKDDNQTEDIDNSEEISTTTDNSDVESGYDSDKFDITDYKQPKRNPKLAAALSFVVPGTGQFYNEQTNKGFLHLGIYGLAMWGGISCLDWTLDRSGVPGDLAALSFTIAFFTMFLSMRDAHINANKLNEKYGFTFAPNKPNNYLVTEEGTTSLIAFSFTM